MEIHAYTVIFCPHCPQTTDRSVSARVVTCNHSAITTQECVVCLKCRFVLGENFGQVVPKSRAERIGGGQTWDKRTVSFASTVVEFPGRWEAQVIMLSFV